MSCEVRMYKACHLILMVLNVSHQWGPSTHAEAEQIDQTIESFVQRGQADLPNQSFRVGHAADDKAAALWRRGR